MARIMGQDITSRDLLPIFDGFLKDLDEVRIGILKHLADFFELLLPKERRLVRIIAKSMMHSQISYRNFGADWSRLLSLNFLLRFQYLQRIRDFMNCDNQRNWRFRLELANQVFPE